MDNLLELLKEEARKYGNKVEIISIEHLEYLKNDIKTFSRNEELNDFQRWIVSDLYNFKVPEVDFNINSIILTALSHPFYADVIFNKDGKEYTAKSLVLPEYDKSDSYLKSILGKSGYNAITVDNLPLKRLAVQSGFAEYGRNNITYIIGMGSNYSLKAYYSDLPCKDDTWRDILMAEVCENCDICVNKCPTGAIREDKFLIDNQRCLSAMNEVAGEFPEWLSPSVHHTCYDCLRCQENCPMNYGHLNKYESTVIFSDSETEKLLQGIPVEDLNNSTKEKIYKLGIDQWYAAIPRNINVLLTED